MYVVKFMVIHPIAVEILHSEPKFKAACAARRTVRGSPKLLSFILGGTMNVSRLHDNPSNS